MRGSEVYRSNWYSLVQRMTLGFARRWSLTHDARQYRSMAKPWSRCTLLGLPVMVLVLSSQLDRAKSYMKNEYSVAATLGQVSISSTIWFPPWACTVPGGMRNRSPTFVGQLEMKSFQFGITSRLLDLRQSRSHSSRSAPSA